MTQGLFDRLNLIENIVAVVGSIGLGFTTWTANNIKNDVDKQKLQLDELGQRQELEIAARKDLRDSVKQNNELTKTIYDEFVEAITDRQSSDSARSDRLEGVLVLTYAISDARQQEVLARAVQQSVERIRPKGSGAEAGRLASAEFDAEELVIQASGEQRELPVPVGIPPAPTVGAEAAWSNWKRVLLGCVAAWRNSCSGARRGRNPGEPHGHDGGHTRNCVAMLQQGECVMVFPEGARGANKPYRKRYQLQSFGLGFMRLALETTPRSSRSASSARRSSSPASRTSRGSARGSDFPRSRSRSARRGVVSLALSRTVVKFVAEASDWKPVASAASELSSWWVSAVQHPRRGSVPARTVARGSRDFRLPLLVGPRGAELRSAASALADHDRTRRARALRGPDDETLGDSRAEGRHRSEGSCDHRRHLCERRRSLDRIDDGAHLRPAALFGRSDFPARQLWGYALPRFLAGIGIQFFSRLDLLAVKAWSSSPEDAGLYGAAQGIFVIRGLISGAMAPVIMATVSRLSSEGRDADVRLVIEQIFRLDWLLVPIGGLVAGTGPAIAGLIYGDAFRWPAGVGDPHVRGDRVSCSSRSTEPTSLANSCSGSFFLLRFSRVFIALPVCIISSLVRRVRSTTRRACAREHSPGT